MQLNTKLIGKVHLMNLQKATLHLVWYFSAFPTNDGPTAVIQHMRRWYWQKFNFELKITADYKHLGHRVNLDIK